MIEATTDPQDGTSRQIFVLTGNPFIDSGIAALCAMCGKAQPDELTTTDVKKQIHALAKRYSEVEWQNNLHGLVFPNAEIGNPAIKGNKAEVYRDALLRLLYAARAAGTQGTCVACGARNGEPLTKTRIPLLGSGKLVNFFPSGSPGERFCPVCALAVQFMTHAAEKVGKGVLIMASGSWAIQLAYARRVVKGIRERELKKEYGLFTEKHFHGANAIFHALRDILNNPNLLTMTSSERPPLRFYHFTNYNQAPDVTLYDLPNSVLDFLIEVGHKGKTKDWMKVVRKGYPKPRATEEETERSVLNRVYVRLMEGKSILSYFFLRDEFKVIGDWDLVVLYLRRVMKMKPKRIETLKRVADQVLEMSKESGGTKRIVQLDRARSYFEFRQALLRIQKEAVAKRGAPLVTLDEFTEDIAPEGSSDWRDTRDLLLFRIYEVGADWLKSHKDDLAAIEEEDGSK